MTAERKKILEMLAAGKLSVDEAERLLRAVEGGGDFAAAGAGSSAGRGADAGGGPKAAPKFLRIHVASKDGDNVNVRVPMALLYSGMKLAALMPTGVQDKVETALADKGIHVDLAKLNPAQLEELIASLGELSVDVDSRQEKVRIFCE